MKRLAKYWLPALSVLLLSAVVLAAEIVAIKAASSRTGRSSLDADSTIALTIHVTESGVELHWRPILPVPEWAVLFSDAPSAAIPETLAVTADTFFVLGDVASLPEVHFYSVVPLLSGPDESPIVIEDFESSVSLSSIPGEDAEPNDWQVISSDSYNPD